MRAAIVTIALLIAALFAPFETENEVRNTIAIARPTADVFRYVTDPASWPHWHPSSRGVSGALGHSLQVGEQVSEEFVVAGHTGTALWTVAQRSEPSLWSISGEIKGKKRGVVTYRLNDTAEGARFERTFTYFRPNLASAILDRALLHERITLESTTAVRQLKATIEGRYRHSTASAF